MPEWNAQLIATCGTTAVRVVRTCERMGVRAKALVAADPHGPEVEVPCRADALVDRTTGWEKILLAARQVQATALHPGIGMDAQSAEFAERVIAAGFSWIGASPSMLRFAQDHDAVFLAAERVGFTPSPRNDTYLVWKRHAIESRARQLGYPISLTSFVGPGKLFEIPVDSPSELDSALTEIASPKHLTASTDLVGIRKHLQGPRRVIVDFLGLPDGGVMVLGLRDVTAEWNGQPMVEETPPVSIPQTQWVRVLDRAAQFVVAIGYIGIGAIIALVDEADGVYFESLLPCLSTGHATTEMATGADLVELQLRCALGEFERLQRDDPPVIVSGHVVTVHLLSTGSEGNSLDDAAAAGLPRSEDEFQVESSCLFALPAVDLTRDVVLASMVAHGVHRPAAMRKIKMALSGLDLGRAGTNVQALRALFEGDAFWHVPVDLTLSEHRNETEEKG